MSYINPTELSLLKTFPQETELYLSIYKPNTVLACRVNDASIDRKARVITYDGVTEGSYTQVESGMVAYVGTSLGSDDKGRIRVRSATSTEIVVAENSHIDWADDDYLTIVNFFEITAVFPRIIQDPADELNVIFYKDYDIEYTNQNEYLGFFPCMGPHRAVFRDPATGLATLYYSASGTSSADGGSSGSFAWWFQGAQVTGSFAQTPGYITYDTPGHYTTRLYISGTNVEEYSYRHISVYDRPEVGTNVPILNWELVNLSGSRDDSGYTATIRVRTDVARDDIKDGSLVVIFADDYYGDTKQSIGGNAPNSSSIVFTGYIYSGTIEYNWYDGYIEFEVVSPTKLMQDVEGFAISVESKVSPTTWYELKDMYCKKAVYHYLRWHSTALLCNDFEFVGTDQRVQYFDTDRESLYHAIKTFMENTLVGNFVCDRQGKMWAEVEVKATNNATSSFEHSNLKIDKDLWIGTPVIVERTRPAISYLEMGGIQYDGPEANTFVPLLSMAPGDPPGYIGGQSRRHGLAVLDQDGLNVLTGNVYAWENSRYPTVRIQCAGNFRNFDIAPIEIVDITVERDDTPRGISFTDKAFTVQGIEYEYAEKLLLPTLITSEVTQGLTGESLIIPVEPPTEDGTSRGGGSFKIPPISVPPIPTIPYPTIISTRAAAEFWTSWNLNYVTVNGISCRIFDYFTVVKNVGMIPYGVRVLRSGTYDVTVTLYAYGYSLYASLYIMRGTEALYPSSQGFVDILYDEISNDENRQSSGKRLVELLEGDIITVATQAKETGSPDNVQHIVFLQVVEV